VVLCHRLLGIGPNPSTKDAELIAFRVGEYHPRRVTLPDVAHDNPAQGLRCSIDQARPDHECQDDLLPNEIHVAHSARSVSQADAPTDVERNTVRVVAADKLDDSCSPRHQRDWQVGPQSVIAGRVRCGRLRFLLWGCARELHR
jgi:hypothetical protein